ncbi:MAG TPA: hypothetical protein VNZ53_11240, partial [Steroidobacteraceae bacterium]|nr:hypothetical protein [Steroidobacteraceae bacterium]
NLLSSAHATPAGSGREPVRFIYTETMPLGAANHNHWVSRPSLVATRKGFQAVACGDQLSCQLLGSASSSALAIAPASASLSI